MSRDELLGQLHQLHELQIELFESISEADAYRVWHPDLAPLSWYLGRSVYLESYWIREQVLGDDTLTTRIREIFPLLPKLEQAPWGGLPPKDHLLNWALEQQEEHITLLANPGQLPAHPLLDGNELLMTILHARARYYEQMLMVLSERQASQPIEYQVTQPLIATTPDIDPVEVTFGHYRIGAKDDPTARDNEQPPQLVELSNFRIARLPINNTNYLAFLQAGGYSEKSLWSEAGWNSKREDHPHGWNQDDRGYWYGTGLNGPFDLVGEDPVSGINQHEANAFILWAAQANSDLKGAVLQHEYQWEIAARSGLISGTGRVWEWCANSFHPYPNYQSPTDPEQMSLGFDRDITLKGASLHTQRILRRASYRNHAPANSKILFSGARLVLPPE